MLLEKLMNGTLNQDSEQNAPANTDRNIDKSPTP
jgi:hypothetical protein